MPEAVGPHVHLHASSTVCKIVFALFRCGAGQFTVQLLSALDTLVHLPLLVRAFHLSSPYQPGLLSLIGWRTHLGSLKDHCGSVVRVGRTFWGLVLHIHCSGTVSKYYVNRQGGAHTTVLCQKAIRLWQFCIEEHINPIADCLPRVQNHLVQSGLSQHVF